MKALILFPYAPLPPPHDLGGTKRNLPFLLELARYNDVSVLSYGTAEEEQMFREAYGKLCRHVQFVNRKRPRILNALELFWLLGTGRSSFRQFYRKNMQRAIDEMTGRERFDVIHCCVQMFGYFRFPTGIPVVSDTHEVTYDLLYRTYKNSRNLFRKVLAYLSYRLGKEEELELCGKFDLLIATTERDCGVFRKELPDLRIEVIQNGAGGTFFEATTYEQEPDSMVFTGLFTHYPNVHGMLWFLDEALPRILEKKAHAKVYIVGKYPPKELRARASEHVIVTGFVEDVRPFMGRASVYIIPLLVGGGIRGKALEAMAMRRPIVTTTIGVEGILLTNEVSALFADSGEQFAGAVVRLLDDPAFARRIADDAYATAIEKYKWEAKGKELQHALESVLREGSSPSVQTSGAVRP